MTLTIQTIIGASVITLLSACGGSGGSNSSQGVAASSTIASQYQGTWLAQAYGRGLKIGASKIEFFDYTSGFCLLENEESGVTTADIESIYLLEGDELVEFGGTGTASFSAPATRFRPANTLPTACQSGYTKQRGQPGYQEDAAADLWLFFQMLDEYSVSPEAAQVDIAQLYATVRETVPDQEDDAALTEAIYQLLLPLGDIHSSLVTPDSVVKLERKPTLVYLLLEEYLTLNAIEPPLSDAQVAAANAYIDSELARDTQVALSYADGAAGVHRGANDQLAWFENAGVGYLAIYAMTDFAASGDKEDQLSALESALDAAISDLRDVDALIVDVRRNGGGQDFLSLAIASRFVANPTLVYRKQARLGNARTALQDVVIAPRGEVQYLGPVYLLTSHSTVSAAEAFTLAMRELPQVTLVGQPTQGAFSDVLEKHLTNGFEVTLSNEYYLSVDGQWFEGQGVPVDIAAPVFARAARQEGIDAGIEVVLTALSP
tara:strand:- start:15314 stop:16783 length:1470 start_codon:yes stop_codon:yes gene_type:complete